MQKRSVRPCWLRTQSTPIVLALCWRPGDGRKLDKEVFYLGCLPHDLGLSDTHKAAPGSFDWVAANLGITICL